jgi:hypothetical protein
MGRMDLVAEHTRRGLSAAGLPEIAPSGKHLAAGPAKPLPTLAELEIREREKQKTTLRRRWPTGCCQSPMTGVPTSGSRPKEHRYEVLLDATDEFHASSRK